ncbi:hypothetical protein [Rathayibacter soli]|uniref:hypothetical protein n=1 Tax=Rathayibacter soli TaxID=3144168 RepID=UPI0027E4F483|nr:hypothetical protein [Glaciibacter superstes]
MELTNIEQSLVDHVVDGTVLDLASGIEDEAIDENAMKNWGPEHDISAQVLRDILRGRQLPEVGPDPHGLQLRGARIIGRIDLKDVTTPIRLRLLSCHLPDGLDGRDCHIPGLELSGSVVSVEGEDCKRGAVRILGAHINGQLSMSGAALINKAGSALDADGATIDGDVFLNNKFTAIGHGDSGTIRLLGAHITGQLVMRHATLTNKAGSALTADGATIDGGMFLDNEFTAIGHGRQAAVRLLGTHITGQLIMRRATLTNQVGSALTADRTTIDGDVFLDDKFTAIGHGRQGAVRLANMHITGRLVVSDASVDLATAGMGWVVDGLIYNGYPTATLKTWLSLLQRGTPEYKPQPYQQLAAVARAAGHDSDARRALMKQRDDQVIRGKLTPPLRAWLRFTKLTLGYGYQPWRALIGVAGVFLIAVMTTMYVPGAVANTATATGCTWVEKFQISVDMAIPLVSTSTGTTCHVTSTSGGQFVAWVGVFLTLAGWALTALFAAGFTRAIRRP